MKLFDVECWYVNHQLHSSNHTTDHFTHQHSTLNIFINIRLIQLSNSSFYSSQ